MFYSCTCRLRLLLAMLLGVPLLCAAQLDDDEWFYGFAAGATYARIEGIATTLIRPIYPAETYTTSVVPTVGFSTAAFVHFRMNNSRFAVQPGIGYADLGGQFDYTDIEDLNYSIDFRYNYLRLLPAIKYYPAGGLNLTVGASVGFILNSERLSYVSNQPDIGPDLQIQQSLRGVLKGRGNVGAVVGVGYDLPMGLGLNFSYIHGLTDVLETQANGFYFIESNNQSRAFELSVSYAMPFFR